MLQIFMPASGSLSNFFLCGNCGTAEGSALGLGAVDAETAACRPPNGLCRLRLLEGVETGDGAGATAAVAA
ncbi:MAG: hypothetical protein WBV96_17735, partial [Polyangia bacterium]